MTSASPAPHRRQTARSRGCHRQSSAREPFQGRPQGGDASRDIGRAGSKFDDPSEFLANRIIKNPVTGAKSRLAANQMASFAAGFRVQLLPLSRRLKNWPSPRARNETRQWLRFRCCPYRAASSTRCFAVSFSMPEVRRINLTASKYIRLKSRIRFIYLGLCALVVR